MASRSLKVLVVGSDRVSEAAKEREQALKEVSKAGREIGAALARRGHTVVVGSDQEHDVDPYVVMGALEADAAAPIEVHVAQGEPDPYTKSDTVKPGQIKVVAHQFPNWDVTVLDTIEEVDGIIGIGGRTGVVQAGLAGWKMGKPVIPIGNFGGGGNALWQYGSSTRQSFYRGALADRKVDELAGTWRDSSAEHVVDALETVERRVAFTTSSKSVMLTAIAFTVVACIGWILTLMVPYSSAVQGAQDPTPWLMVGFFLSVGIAGLLGATMQTLRRVRDGARIEAFRSVVDVSLGLAAGLVTAMLFLVAQLAVQGEVVFSWTEKDYSRVVLLGSLASLFASLYLDSALARFDTVKESALAGKYEG